MLGKGRQGWGAESKGQESRMAVESKGDCALDSGKYFGPCHENNYQSYH